MSESMVVALLAVGGAYVVVALLMWVLQVVANWRIFTKAGEAGWKSIVPVYSGYVCYKIAWKPVMFWISFIASFVASYTSELYTMGEGSTVVLIILFAAAIVMAVVNIMYALKLAKAFGKGTGFAIGLMFLQPIFLLILGLGSAEYKGADR